MNLTDLQKSYPYVDLEFKNIDNCMILSKILIPLSDRNLGIGTVILTMFTEYCDKHGNIAMLTPEKIDSKTNMKRLYKFYKKFGFKLNRGKNKDYSLPNYRMIRHPKVIKYVITGVDRDNKRFIINTTTPQHYNIWSGSLWQIVNGKRKLIKRY